MRKLSPAEKKLYELSKDLTTHLGARLGKSERKMLIDLDLDIEQVFPIEIQALCNLVISIIKRHIKEEYRLEEAEDFCAGLLRCMNKEPFERTKQHIPVTEGDAKNNEP